ncbi:unnamed protein product [Microthlaspi erraticum]|uniref:Uncharacterized protein n=1 Tax=Microthlaspi erraticum TaxID=1685480 RepID=A0A6D2KZX2_9BRAS|nr:unnamed protein product [Microthlaspi erraticum]
MESYKELTWREEDGNLQAARDTLWFTYGEGNLWNIKEMNSKECGLQSLKRDTLLQGQKLPKSGAQC